MKNNVDKVLFSCHFLSIGGYSWGIVMINECFITLWSEQLKCSEHLLWLIYWYLQLTRIQCKCVRLYFGEYFFYFFWSLLWQLTSKSFATMFKLWLKCGMRVGFILLLGINKYFFCIYLDICCRLTNSK